MTSPASTIWRHRDVLALLIRRDLAVKYQESVLGYLWSLLEPLGLAAVYWFVFSTLYHTKVAPKGAPYLLFLVSGLFAWMWANSAMSEATGALTSQSRLITTMKVPREIFPLGRVIGRFAEYLAGLPVIIVIALVYRTPVTRESVIALPLALVLEAMLLTGIAFLLASVNVMMRDVERVLRVVLRVLFYAAPIIYPISKVTDSHIPGWGLAIYEANPFVGILQLHHAVWYPSQFPHTGMLLAATAGSAGMLVFGWWVFKRLEPAVLKEL
jgi:ABC-2 type transport system permease protein